MSLYLNNASFYRITHNLSQLGNLLSQSNYRLTTGKRVNTAADDPAATIAATNLSGEIAQINGAITNASRIGSIAQTADGALSEMSTLIETIQNRTVLAASSGTTDDERAAYQAEIDLAIEALDKLVQTTSYNGTVLLDGALGYTTSGVDSNDIVDVKISSVNSDSTPLAVTVSNVEAEKAQLTIDYGDASPATDVTFTIAGNLGSVEYTFSAGTSRGLIANTINADAATHGVSATYTGTEIQLTSASTGSDQYVSINVTSGSYPTTSGETIDYGGDATVTVNGVNATLDGRGVTFNTGTISGSFTMTSTFAAAAGSTSFNVTGGGADFRLDSSSNGKVHFGQASLRSTNLGNDTLGYLSSLKSGAANALSTGNYSDATDIATKALQQVSAAQARWGALKTYTVDSTVNSLTVAKTAMTEARSELIDLDYAEETANNNRLQILMSVGSQIISAMNQNASSVLSLLSF